MRIHDDYAPPILEMRGIVKRFPGLVALDGVDLSVRRGEIHALIGQNGAGKSTLMKILSGVYTPDEGDIRVEGLPVSIHYPREALRLGIGTVYQDLSLVPQLSVADNIYLGREPGNGFVIDQTAIRRSTQALFRRLEVRDIDGDERVGRLPLAQQQLVEIAKVLSHEPRILILDEPTAPLADEETAHLFRILRGLREQGIAIIFISHRFKEILQQCDRATILRNGRLVTTIDMQGVSEDELVELTIGERLETFFHHAEQMRANADVVLEVSHLSVRRAVRDVSFTVGRGEIVGITGLLGAGQNELARALFGIQDGVRGTIKRRGLVVRIRSPRQAVRLGIGLLTEHRKLEGLVPDMSVKENISLPSLAAFRRLTMFIHNGRERWAVRESMQQLNVKAASSKVKVSTLSGGNQQKVILGKWLLRDLDVLIFISPTQGIDVGAKAEIYAHLSELANQGKSIIVVSEDLLEILGISDRIFVMYNRRLTRIFQRGEVDEETLLSAVQGATL